MGNAALRDLAVIEPISFEEVSGSVVAVDAHNWLYRYLTTTVKWTRDSVYTTEDGTEVANLVGLIQGLPKFFENDLTTQRDFVEALKNAEYWAVKLGE